MQLVNATFQKGLGNLVNSETAGSCSSDCREQQAVSVGTQGQVQKISTHQTLQLAYMSTGHAPA